MRAFANDPLFRWLIPDDVVYETGTGELMHRILFLLWCELGEVWTTDDCVAVAAWGPPEMPSMPEALAMELADLRTRLTSDVLERLGVLRPTLQAHRPAEPHWYLNILGTHPDWQRQGLGMAVMTNLRDRCDSEGLGQYLETATDEDIAYYRSRGFEVLGQWELEAMQLTGMWRAPGAGAR